MDLAVFSVMIIYIAKVGVSQLFSADNNMPFFQWYANNQFY
jgi:hypothetical protein